MQSEKLFQRVVPNDQSFTDNYAGNNVFIGKLKFFILFYIFLI